MKNTFKKQDYKGNKLPEEIGKGLNKNFCDEVIKARLSEVPPRRGRP